MSFFRGRVPSFPHFPGLRGGEENMRGVERPEWHTRSRGGMRDSRGRGIWMGRGRGGHYGGYDHIVAVTTMELEGMGLGEGQDNAPADEEVSSRSASVASSITLSSVTESEPEDDEDSETRSGQEDGNGHEARTGTEV